jgi:protoporphyrinogen oxidase
MRKRIAIVGGGPAGLSLARQLQSSNQFSATVFEAEPKPGGKSFTFVSGEAVVEMGTCYTTRAHQQVLRWMKQEGITLKTLRDQSFDGKDFLDYVKAAGGPPLPVQIARFLHARARLLKKLGRPVVTQAAREEASRMTSDWLRSRHLHKIERFMYRSMTNLGYGFVDETPIVQALRWNDLDLILTGLLKQLKMPVEGWTAFWERLSSGLDVRTATAITNIDRDGQTIRLTDDSGEIYIADGLVCAIPIDAFDDLTTPTNAESLVSRSIQWNRYTTTLIATSDRFTESDVAAWSRALVPGAPAGQVMSARYDGFEPQLGGHLYLTGQLGGAYSDDELRELLVEDIRRHGGDVANIILQKTWKYFARYDDDAIRAGLLTQMRDMQGDRRTWYTGTTFSHEAVSNIVNFNHGLVQKMHRDLQ